MAWNMEYGDLGARTHDGGAGCVRATSMELYTVYMDHGRYHIASITAFASLTICI